MESVAGSASNKQRRQRPKHPYHPQSLHYILPIPSTDTMPDSHEIVPSQFALFVIDPVRIFYLDNDRGDYVLEKSAGPRPARGDSSRCSEVYGCRHELAGLEGLLFVADHLTSQNHGGGYPSSRMRSISRSPLCQGCEPTAQLRVRFAASTVALATLQGQGHRAVQGDEVLRSWSAESRRGGCELAA